MSFISQITDPEELRVLEQDRIRWQWQNIMAEGIAGDFGEWLKTNHLPVWNEYESYAAATEPGVYYLDLSSWCWNHHQGICKIYMGEQGIE